MITDEKIEHLAYLAKLNVPEDNTKIKKQLTDIFGEIEKIVDVSIREEIMISPTDNHDEYEEDIIGNHISKEDAFKNAKHVKGDYIVVPKVIE